MAAGRGKAFAAARPARGTPRRVHGPCARRRARDGAAAVPARHRRSVP